MSRLELFDSLKELDGEALHLQGDLRNRAGVFRLSAVTVNIGNVGVAISGEFDSRDLSANLSVGANAPDSELLDRFLPGKKPPPGALLLNGNIERNTDSIRFTDTSLRLGEFSLEVDGTLSNSPLSNSSDLQVSVAGPNLREFGINARPRDFAAKNLPVVC